MAQRSNGKAKSPGKPHPDFPLFRHATGQWAKKVKGKLHYFGTDPDEALARWLDQKDDLLAGRTPRAARPDQVTVDEVVNGYLAAKQVKASLGEISQAHFEDLKGTGKYVLEKLGRKTAATALRPTDFMGMYQDLADRYSLPRLTREITIIRSFFRWASDPQNDLLAEPVRMGTEFKPPSKTRQDAYRNKQRQAGLKLFTAEQCRGILAHAKGQLRAMVLLALNGGLGNTDLAELPLSAVNLQAGWVDYPRPKTGNPRRIPMWEETTAAVAEVINGTRPTPKDQVDAGLLFLTKYGQKWVRMQIPKGIASQDRRRDTTLVDSINLQFRKAANEAGIDRTGKRLGFYTLRHVFSTVADGAIDPVAKNFIMGHVPAEDRVPAMYRQTVDDSRLQAVAEHVHRWLFEEAEAKGTEQMA